MEIAEIIKALEELDNLRKEVETLRKEVETLRKENEDLRKENESLRKEETNSQTFRERIAEWDIHEKLKDVLIAAQENGKIEDEFDVLLNAVQVKEELGERGLEELIDKVLQDKLDSPEDNNVEDILRDIVDGQVQKYDSRQEAWVDDHEDEDVVNPRYEDYFDWDGFLDAYFDEDEFIETDNGEFIRISRFK